MEKVPIENKRKDIEKRTRTRQRSKSLFEAERPNLADTDRGVFVVSHADFPKKRTQSESPDPCENILLKPILANEEKIKKIIHDLFENALTSKSYSLKECSLLGPKLAEKIKDKVSELQLTHYKLVCTCIITKRANPGPIIESGCVWNVRNTSADHDAFVELTYKNQTFFALGTVYGVYDAKFEKLSIKSSIGRPSPIPE